MTSTERGCVCVRGAVGSWRLGVFGGSVDGLHESKVLQVFVRSSLSHCPTSKPLPCPSLAFPGLARPLPRARSDPRRSTSFRQAQPSAGAWELHGGCVRQGRNQPGGRLLPLNLDGAFVHTSPSAATHAAAAVADANARAQPAPARSMPCTALPCLASTSPALLTPRWAAMI